MSGGRYDNLLAHFGRDFPACGFAIGVERVLAALHLQGDDELSLAPEIIAELDSSPALAQRVTFARASGKRVEWSLQNATRKELIVSARERGARAVWFADGSEELL